MANRQQRCSKESNSRMSTETRNFRYDINGLRAWAVTAVVLFHFGVSGFSGGFAGVDIFFVISGFLMTGIVVEGLEQSTQSKFSVLEFYMARARRILPALIALITVLLLLGWWALLPLDYEMLGKHSASAVSFLSNIIFWREDGYFNTASHEKWLLHTWSLSVEWQFYLILPLVLVSLWKIRPSRQLIFYVLLTGFIASLSLSIVLTPIAPSAAFYILPTRAWEMLAGGLIYLITNHINITNASRKKIELAGFILITGSIFGFDSSSSWPGALALIPVSGTMLILLAAQSKSHWTGLATTQWLGTRSYSLYLWHWPLVVALTYWEKQEAPLFIAAGLAVTIILGHLSYKLVESPSRKFLTNISLSKSAITILGCVAIITTTGLLIKVNKGIYGRLDPEAETISLESLNSNPRRDECMLRAGVESPSCNFGGDNLRAVVMGDSHANALLSAIVSAAPSPEIGVMELTYSACPIIYGVHSLVNKQCGEFVDWAIHKLQTVPNDVPVIIINRHAQSALGANEDSSKKNKPQVYFSKLYQSTQQEFLDEYGRNLTDTACMLAKTRTVYLVRPIPEMGISVPISTARTVLWNTQKAVNISIAEYNQRQAFVWQAQDAAHERCGVKILDPLPYLCTAGRCYGAKNNRPLYFDDDHLSESGNKVLVPMFSEVFKLTPPSAPLTGTLLTH